MATSRNSIILVIIAALIMSISQIFLKIASKKLKLQIPISLELLREVLSIELLLGVLLLSIAALIYIVALKNGELSILYPIFASSYIWIAIFSPIVFPTDSLNLVKVIGIIIIIGGVYCTGRGSTT